MTIFNGTQCLNVIDGADQDSTHLQVYDCVADNANQQFYYTGDNRSDGVLAWDSYRR